MVPPRKPSARSHRVTFDNRLLLLSLAAGLPGILASLILIWKSDWTPSSEWTLGLLLVLWWGLFSLALRERVISPLHTLANLLAALREGDFSMRARASRKEDSLAEVMREANVLSDTLHHERLGAMEATALLRKVMDEIDVAVFAFDEADHLRLLNRAAQNLLGQPVERVLGSPAAMLGLASCLQGEPHRVESIPGLNTPAAPGPPKRWGISRSRFRQSGVPMQLLVLSDLSRALREEELAAWQRLVRVLGHEINNSLAPIVSLAGSMEALLHRQPRAPDWQQDLERGLRVVGARAEALSRFTAAYARLARLPKPKPRPLDVGALVKQVTGLETRMKVEIENSPDVTVQADGDQMEQLLINLVRNAVDAALQTHGGVRVGWNKSASHLELWIEDDGPGLAGTANLFVPFFTTKPGGTGIGLVLSRQIAEAHGGLLSLGNRANGGGCKARLVLPLR